MTAPRLSEVALVSIADKMDELERENGKLRQSLILSKAEALLWKKAADNYLAALERLGITHLLGTKS